jgi:hypothetical protein
MLHAAKGERYSSSSAIFAQAAHQPSSSHAAAPAPLPAPVTRDEIFTATPTNALLVTLHMENLPKMDGGLTGKSDPYFLVYGSADKSGPLLHVSEVISKELNPKFAPFMIHILYSSLSLLMSLL